MRLAPAHLAAASPAEVRPLRCSRLPPPQSHCWKESAESCDYLGTPPRPKAEPRCFVYSPMACSWPAELGPSLFRRVSLDPIEGLLRPPCEADSVRLACKPVARCYDPIVGTDSRRQILRISDFGISVWGGTASTTPVLGFDQSEWDAPSRLRQQPCLRKCLRRPTRFMARRSCHARRRPVHREGLLHVGPQEPTRLLVQDSLSPRPSFDPGR